MTSKAKKAEEKTATRKAAKAVKSTEAASEKKKGIPLVVLSNGIRLRCKPVPPFLLDHVAAQVPEPEPPQVKIVLEGHEDRWEENPDDPEYIASVVAWRRLANMTSINAMLIIGTEAEYVPKGYFLPEEDGWLKLLEVIGAKVEFENESERYLAWLKLYALASTADIAAVTNAVGSSIGVKEEDVAKAAASFPSAEVGGVDSSAPSEEGS